MPTTKCRFGILGAAQIAAKNWQAIARSGNCQLVAVASRQRTKAEQFIAQYQRHLPLDPPPVAVEGYEALLARADIDAIYLPLPTGLRIDWAIAAAQAGKHILVEKPIGRNAAEARRMIDACRASGVQFMDGVMFMHSQRLAQLRSVLDDGQSIGPIQRITSQFSFKGDEPFFANDIRCSGELEPLGCLGDLGWYNIRFTLWAMNEQLPRKVSAHALASHQRPNSGPAVPTEFSAELFFDGGASASFYCSFLAENQQWAVISGRAGVLQVADFVLPYYGGEAAFEVWHDVFDIDGCDFKMRHHAVRHAVAEYSNSAANAQEANQFRTFAQLALSGKPDYRWAETALATQRVADACVESARTARPVELRD